MGYFRRFKLSDYTADECRKHLKELQVLLMKEFIHADKLFVSLLEEWACFRELLARHENQNESQLDKK